MTWFRFRARLVRVHQRDPDPTLEGILMGRRAGHYRLANARVFETADRSLPVGQVWVPAGNVVFLQVLR
jgi:hypothetical protein